MSVVIRLDLFSTSQRQLVEGGSKRTRGGVTIRLKKTAALFAKSKAVNFHMRFRRYWIDINVNSGAGAAITLHNKRNAEGFITTEPRL